MDSLLRPLCGPVPCASSNLLALDLYHTVLGGCISGEAKRFSATRSTAVMKMLSRLDKHVGQKWREYIPLPKTHLRVKHIRAPIFSQPRVCSCSHAIEELTDYGSILGGTPKRVGTAHRRVRSKDSWVLVRSIKHWETVRQWLLLAVHHSTQCRRGCRLPPQTSYRPSTDGV